ncbi:MAG: hypothetical protein HKN03_18770 [Acidimicrobiales bacterium]|nr:hypothetical protein [Acidimicrobiales bacterium]
MSEESERSIHRALPPVRGRPSPLRGVPGFLGRPIWREARSIRELRLLKESPLWQGHSIPEGHGRPVLLIAGFLAGPRTIDALDHVLQVAGWEVRQATVGRNAGPAYRGILHCEENLHQLHESGEKVRVIGHSRGGQYARILAVRFPALVDQVITLGAPLLIKYPSYAVVKVPAEALDRLWRVGTFGSVDVEAEARVDADRFAPFPPDVDFVSIYSRSDGIVDWRTSLDPAAVAVAVDASHAGLPNSIAGVTAVAAALRRR